MTQISIGGFPGVGKTVLLTAFYRSLNQDLSGIKSHSALDIQFSLPKYQQSYYDGKGEFNQLPGTRYPIPEKVYFLRTPKNNEDFSQKISSFSHEINLIDIPGYVFHDLGSRSHDSINPDVNEGIKLFQESDGVILLLEKISSLNYYAGKQDEENYLNNLQNLLNLLEGTLSLPKKLATGSTKKLAICIGKADLLDKLIYRHPQNILHTLFGSKVSSSIEQLRFHFGEENVKLFVLSSFGYDRSGKPNYDPHSNWIRDLEQWIPYRVYEPFFWLFQSLELEQIRLQTQNLNFFKKLLGYSYRLQQAYIPYLSRTDAYVLPSYRQGKSLREIETFASDKLANINLNSSTPYYVFLSYSRSDKEIMNRIRIELLQENISVWVDEEEIEIGTLSWKLAIEEGIKNAAALVFLCSPKSNSSKWVRAELDYAEAHQKQIFVVLIKGQSTDIPLGYTTSQHIKIDISQVESLNIAQLIKAIRSLAE